MTLPLPLPLLVPLAPLPLPLPKLGAAWLAVSLAPVIAGFYPVRYAGDIVRATCWNGSTWLYVDHGAIEWQDENVPSPTPTITAQYPMTIDPCEDRPGHYLIEYEDGVSKLVEWSGKAWYGDAGIGWRGKLAP